MSEVTLSIGENKVRSDLAQSSDPARDILLRAKEVYRERGEHTPLYSIPRPGGVCVLTALRDLDTKSREDRPRAMAALCRASFEVYGINLVDLNANCDDETSLGLFDLALQYLDA